MTKKMFWENPYLTTHDTRVSRVNGTEVTLYSTIFYAFAGGQESDQGTISGYPVCSTRKDDMEIVYTLPENHGLVPGQPVEIKIDWNRRYQLMRLHFAAELVLELCYKVLTGVNKLGAHIGPEKARIDFAWPENLSPMLPALTAEVNNIIAADLGITSAFADEPRERRYWEIDGFARVACGGTHIKRTAEVGPIKLRRNNIGQGKERIEIYLCSLS
ncbi:alanyl-tRNA editing protein [Geopsychrobacter electrodiphilus]|uniref:alanyl-tRNA editing protein n=1 Tax=Geopsychrobacter electrodiphilus TaxID=225196 RepID=UPI00036441DD|nr:alanyl-tRNA editing protein [Geopsychrobacter electrodiphilus]